MKSTPRKSDPGFTLLEVLVALVIVSITVTVFFQLLSSSTRLEFRSRRAMDFTVQTTQAFRDLMFFDVRDPDFPWEGERDGYAWRLRLQPLEGVQEDLEFQEVQINVPTELYRYLFTLTDRDSGRNMTLTMVQAYDTGFFSEDFKNRLAFEDDATKP